MAVNDRVFSSLVSHGGNQINERVYNYLGSLGFTGTISDRLAKYTHNNKHGWQALIEGFGLSHELIINGTFDTDVDGWSAGLSATLTWQSGSMRIENGAASSGRAEQIFPAEVGETYEVTVNRGDTSVAGSVRFSINGGFFTYNGDAVANTLSSPGEFTTTFEATDPSMYMALYVNSTTLGAWVEVDDISVKRV